MKTYTDIEYSFRPESYWEELDPLSAVLHNITGENRRRMITDYWNERRLDDLDLSLLCDEPDCISRTRLGRIHPSFLGGEYLPPYLLGEVEIARISLQSTTKDVITLRARPVPDGIAYRIEDEHQGTFSVPIAVSVSPLTLAEVIRQFDKGRLQEMDWDGGLTLGYNSMNAEFCNFENLRDFTRISSRVYPQLEMHFKSVFEEWVKESCAEREAEANARSHDIVPKTVKTKSAPGLLRCQQCGEFKGTTLGRFLNWGEHSMHRSRESSITVTCLCHGSLCAHCKTHRIHRPGTNSYHERTNTIGYVPAFAGMRPCNSCEERDSAKSSEQEAAS